MCNQASFILTSENTYWSKRTDSHDEILAEHKLRDGIAGKVRPMAIISRRPKSGAIG